MKQTIKYTSLNYIGTVTDTNLKNAGYKVVQVEEASDFNATKGCLLALLFPPLIVFGKRTVAKVTYEKQD